MKEKIIKNKEVLRGITFYAKLKSSFYKFKIVYVNEDIIKISISFKYDELVSFEPNSFEDIIRNTIIDISPNNSLSLSRQATISKNKLKKVPITVDGNEFKFEYITISQVMLVKFIEYPELLNSNEGSFLSFVKKVIEDNLLDNPPKPKPHSPTYAVSTPFYDSVFDTMTFQELGERRTVVSEAQLEKNREKFKEQYENEKHKREKMEKLEKELNLDKKSNTRNLARFR